jgi:hypothetical protein
MGMIVYYLRTSIENLFLFINIYTPPTSTMPQITLAASHLQKLLQVNAYPYSHTAYLVFGIRGAVAVGDTTKFKAAHSIQAAELNYKNPRCLIGIWHAVDNTIALFSASTVPNINFIKKAALRKAKANCMMSGFFIPSVSRLRTLRL